LITDVLQDYCQEYLNGVYRVGHTQSSETGVLSFSELGIKGAAVDA
jgi:hypothetical protein